MVLNLLSHIKPFPSFENSIIVFCCELNSILPGSPSGFHVMLPIIINNIQKLVQPVTHVSKTNRPLLEIANTVTLRLLLSLCFIIIHMMNYFTISLFTRLCSFRDH